MTKEELFERLVHATDDWIAKAPPEDLLRVITVGGLDASYDAASGKVRVFVGAEDHHGPLSKLGIICGGLPVDEALQLNAQAWGASDPPADDTMQPAWFADEPLALEGARHHVREDVTDHTDVLEDVVTGWLRGTTSFDVLR